MKRAAEFLFQSGPYMCSLRSANQHRAFEPNRKIHFEPKMESIKSSTECRRNARQQRRFKIFPMSREAGRMRFCEPRPIPRSCGGLCYRLGVRYIRDSVYIDFRLALRVSWAIE